MGKGVYLKKKGVNVFTRKLICWCVREQRQISSRGEEGWDIKEGERGEKWSRQVLHSSERERSTLFSGSDHKVILRFRQLPFFHLSLLLTQLPLSCFQNTCCWFKFSTVSTVIWPTGTQAAFTASEIWTRHQWSTLFNRITTVKIETQVAVAGLLKPSWLTSKIFYRNFGK